MATTVQRAAVTPEDIGHWSVLGYETTSWAEVFPELKALTESATGKRVTYGLAMAWLAQRHMVGQYLRFCGETFPEIAYAESLADGRRLLHVLDGLRQGMGDILDAVGLAIDPTPQLEGALRDGLDISSLHYQFVLDQHAWLKKAPFGAVPVFSDGTQLRFQRPMVVHDAEGRRTVGPSRTEAVAISGAPFPAGALLPRQALRLYPIVTSLRDGAPAMFWANIDWVTAGGAPQEVLAAMQVPRSTQPATRWGMLSRIGADVRSVAREWRTQDAEGLWNGVPVLLEGDAWRALWSCADYRGAVARRGVPKALFDPVRPGSPGLDDTPAIEIACPDLKPAAPGGTASAALPSQAVDVLLAPVGYEAASAAGAVVGGGPMWPEPMTDRLLTALGRSSG